MDIKIVDVDDVTIIELDGMLTIGSEHIVDQSLKEQVANGRKKVILDMTRVKYVDSLGIGQIAGGYTYLSEIGGSLVLARTNDKIKELLRLTGLQNHIKTYETVDAALQEL